MTHTDRRRRYCLYEIAIISWIFCGLLFFLFFQHEKNQDARICELEDRIANLHSESSEIWKDESFNYLAIGNSITIHGKCDYWWNECGMAASSLEKDYVHQLHALIQSQITEPVVTFAHNFYIWEVQSEDRAETLSSLDELMSAKIDLVTIQLGENAFDLNTFEADFEELIRCIQNGSPNAQIVVIGDFWEVSHRDSMKEDACEACGIDFVSLEEIKEKGTYRCGIGTTVFGEDGNPHTVEHEGVANHPGDEAMMWIAKRVFMKVKDK